METCGKKTSGLTARIQGNTKNSYKQNAKKVKVKEQEYCICKMVNITHKLHSVSKDFTH